MDCASVGQDFGIRNCTREISIAAQSGIKISDHLFHPSASPECKPCFAGTGMARHHLVKVQLFNVQKGNDSFVKKWRAPIINCQWRALIMNGGY